ncbi:MAG: DUF357 domain-containing protein [Candidatus Aenigmarchaeota archaeon]|nr:DUF357 domain-containing protein [Candidatus Aenigmarchaeota archaeon]
MVKDRIPKELIEEWLIKLKKKLEKTKPVGKKGEEFLKNIHAYIVDTEHFCDKGDYVKAWELVSFAWGLFEGGEELGVLS